MRPFVLAVSASALAAPALHLSVSGQDRSGAMDTTVRTFLDRHRGSWRDLNVPESDGRILHDLIVRHKFTRALGRRDL